MEKLGCAVIWAVTLLMYLLGTEYTERGDLQSLTVSNRGPAAGKFNVSQIILLGSFRSAASPESSECQ